MKPTFVIRTLAVLLAISTFAYSQGNTWNRIRYNGGTVRTNVRYKDWDNTLTVTSDLITFRLKDSQSVEIPTESVTALSYGQEAHRRVGTMIALGILVAPIALFGLFHKTRLHFIGIEYTTAEKKRAGLLLQGDKNNYRSILMALKSATGAPLSVAAEDRKYIPVGITPTVVADSNDRTEDEAVRMRVPQHELPAASSAQAGATTAASTVPATIPTNSRLQSSASDDPPAKVNSSPSPGVTGPGYFGAMSTDTPRIRHNGITLSGVEQNGPAYQSGLQAGDVIIMFAGQYIYTIEQLSQAVHDSKPGTKVAIRFMRGAATFDTYAIIGGNTKF